MCRAGRSTRLEPPSNIRGLESPDVSELAHLLAIKASFDEQYQRWQITLPLDDLRNRRAGSIHQQGWTINYRFGREGKREFLDYFASHRMTNDTLNRIWEDGMAELLGYCQEFYLAGDGEAERAYFEHNRQFYQMVKEKGLWSPLGDATAE